MSQPPDRFATGWYVYDQATDRAIPVQGHPGQRAVWFVRAAVIAAIGNTAIQLLALPGFWHALAGVYSFAWFGGCAILGIPNWPAYHRLPWRAQLAAGGIAHLGMLGLGWWGVATGQTVTWPRIAAGAAQLTVVIAAGSVYLWARRQP